MRSRKPPWRGTIPTSLRALPVPSICDDETWLHHFRRGDFSRWSRAAIKDDELAAEVEAIERRPGVSVREGRAQVREAIAKRYTV